MVPGGILGGRGTLGVVVGGCEGSRVVHHKVPAGGLCCPYNVSPVRVVVPPAGRSGDQSLHRDRAVYYCWEFGEVSRGLRKILDLSTKRAGLGVPNPMAMGR